MSSHEATVWSLDAPNINEGKIKRRMDALGMTQSQLAASLKIGEGAVSRGLRSQTWLQGKIQEIADNLGVSPIDLTDQIGHTSGTSVLERVCGPAELSGFRLPAGTDIRLLSVSGKWNVFLVAPAQVTVADGDFALLEMVGKRGALVGKVHVDGDSKRWIVTPGGKRRPFSVDRKSIVSMRLIVSALGGVWGSQ